MMRDSKIAKSKKIMKLDDYKQKQLTLPFILPERQKDYSRTIELYDAINKYVWHRIAKKDRIAGRFLDTIVREFEFRNVPYKVRLIPARVEVRKGNEIDVFPGKREELVEDTLRKMAVEGDGVFLNNQVGVLFTLYKLQLKLKKAGHDYNITQLKQAMEVCTGAQIELSTKVGDEKVVFKGPYFQNMGLKTTSDWKKTGKEAKCFVVFNALVTNAVKDKKYQLLDYDKCMSYKSNLARWLHKRLSHNYVQASWNNSYEIWLTSIIRDSGVKKYSSIRNNLRETKKALDELVKQDTILSYDDSDRRVKGRKLVDVKFKLKPSMSFVKDMKKSHALKRLGR